MRIQICYVILKLLLSYTGRHCFFFGGQANKYFMIYVEVVVLKLFNLVVVDDCIQHILVSFYFTYWLA